jgi:hypothetical protein
MLALLVPGVGMGGGGQVAVTPTGRRAVWLTYEDRLPADLAHEDRTSLTLRCTNTLDLTLADQSHAG